MGEWGPRKAVPVPTARQPPCTTRGARRNRPTRIQLPVPKRQSSEVLQVDVHIVQNRQILCKALQQHACNAVAIVCNASFALNIRPADSKCRINSEAASCLDKPHASPECSSLHGWLAAVSCMNTNNQWLAMPGMLLQAS